MEITDKINLRCPKGFYCTKNGTNKCMRLVFEHDRPYCAVYYPFLETDSHGNVLKCEDCLLAERKARLKE